MTQRPGNCLRVEPSPRINAEFVDWSSQQAKPARWLHAGEIETFFDAAELEVDGHQFEAPASITTGIVTGWVQLVDPLRLTSPRSQRAKA
jgi:hypothetical protein